MEIEKYIIDITNITIKDKLRINQVLVNNGQKTEPLENWRNQDILTKFGNYWVSHNTIYEEPNITPEDFIKKFKEFG